MRLTAMHYWVLNLLFRRTDNCIEAGQYGYRRTREIHYAIGLLRTICERYIEKGYIEKGKVHWERKRNLYYFLLTFRRNLIVEWKNHSKAEQSKLVVRKLSKDLYLQQKIRKKTQCMVMCVNAEPMHATIKDG